MTLSKNLFLILLIFISTRAHSKQHVLDDCPERTRFLMNIDTINKYLYMDENLVAELIDECESIKQTSQTLTKSDLFDYAIQKIYFEQNNGNFLKCYQIIKENEEQLEEISITESAKNTFIYIRAYTHMTLGNIASAQKSYYELLKRGRIQKDSFLISQGLYSLGQLYGDEKDYDGAIEMFLELCEFRKLYKLRATTHALIDYELSEAYINKGELEKAEEVILNSLEFVKEQKLERLQPDLLIMQAEIALNRDQISKAKTIYEKISLLLENSKDQFSLYNSQLFHASLLIKQKRYSEAISVYDSLLSQTDSTALNKIQTIFENTHNAFFLSGNLKKAYENLLKKQEVAERIKSKEKKQETAYLQVQFETQQKEKENQQLALQVLQEQSLSRVMYFVTSLFLMGLLILYWAFSQKRKFNQILQSKVKSRTVELENSNKELEQFVYSASHDLKQPLTNIVSFSNLLQQELVTGKIEKNKSYLKYIQDNSDKMMFLIENIMEYSELNKGVCDYVEVDLNDLAKEVSEMMKNDFAERDVQIKIEQSLPTIKYDKHRVLMVFKNIIENGIKYNTSNKPTVLITQKIEGEYVKILFEDNGLGIDSKYHDRLFQMFARLQNQKDYQGSGLGLSICSKIANQMGGSVGIIPNTNLGSKFYFMIPKYLISSPVNESSGIGVRGNV